MFFVFVTYGSILQYDSQLNRPDSMFDHKPQAEVVDVYNTDINMNVEDKPPRDELLIVRAGNPSSKAQTHT